MTDNAAVGILVAIALTLVTVAAMRWAARRAEAADRKRKPNRRDVTPFDLVDLDRYRHCLTCRVASESLDPSHLANHVRADHPLRPGLRVTDPLPARRHAIRSRAA